MKLLLLAAFLAGGIRLENGVFKVSASSAGELIVSVDQPGAPPMMGTTNVTGGEVIFTPRFPLSPGLRYRAEWRPASGEPVRASFELPRAQTAPTAFVERIYPTAGLLPENQLKFYIHFSAPMSRGEAARHIRLLGPDGAAGRLPFLLLEDELWDRDGRRLTLFFDPGRIKRGLVPHNESGMAIVAGQRYTLVIDAGWRDATGLPLKEEFRKEFMGAPADRTSPDPKSWIVRAPKAGTRDALSVEFPEAMDHALLLRMIGVQGVHGAVEVDREERRWLFTPADPWKRGAHALSIDAALEDLAGNKIGKLFDVDVFDKVDRKLESRNVMLPFEIK